MAELYQRKHELLKELAAMDEQVEGKESNEEDLSGHCKRRDFGGRDPGCYRMRSRDRCEYERGCRWERFSLAQDTEEESEATEQRSEEDLGGQCEKRDLS